MTRIGFTFNIKRNNAFDETEIEWDSPQTIAAISKSLSHHGEVVSIEADEKAYQRLKSERLDIVFNYAEGLHGEGRESEIPAMLESLGFPYTGSDPTTMKHCLNKARAKEILKRSGIRTARFAVVRSGEDKLPELGFPCIVKPVWEGSSKGIHNDAVVTNKRGLRNVIETISNKYKQPALVETFLPGREFTIGILGNGPRARILPIIEIDHSVLPGELKPILSYEAKWIIDNPSNPIEILLCPAEVDERLKCELEEISLDTYHVLGCRDWCRIDIRLDEKEDPNILEVNPLPGMLSNPEDNSCLPTAARAAGLSFDDVLNEVLQAAFQRYGITTPETMEKKVE